MMDLWLAWVRLGLDWDEHCGVNMEVESVNPNRDCPGMGQWIIVQLVRLGQLMGRSANPIRAQVW